MTYNIFAALVHFPVYNKRKEVVATSVTTLDLHDIARISRTFGIGCVYVVTPIVAHRELVKRILTHWMEGYGSTYNETRKEAFQRLSVVEDLKGAIQNIKEHTGKTPKIVVTCARNLEEGIEYSKMKEFFRQSEDPYLIIFGTGWGLTDEIMGMADYILKPVDGGTDYNHLPVRGAFAIIIDRLLGR